MGNFVLGAETDINLTGADDVFAPWKFSNPWFGTARGRVGLASGPVLSYVTAGFAYGHVSTTGSFVGFVVRSLGTTRSAGST